MARQRTWTPMQTMLYTSLVPVVAVAGALVLMSVLRSGAQSTPRAEASSNVAAARSDSDARSAERESYRECLRNMGADFGRSQYRSRFSPPPDTKKIREAMNVCGSLLRGGGGPAPAPRRPSTPPIA